MERVLGVVRSVGSLGLVWALVCLCGDVAAQEAPAPGDLTQSGDKGVGYFGGELGFGQLDEDFFISVNLTTAFRLPVPKVFCDGYFPEAKSSKKKKGKKKKAKKKDRDCTTHLGVGLRVPLRFRVIDREPADEGTLREEDWDEFTDFLRVIRFVEYGQVRDPLHVRVGELSGVSLGHGTAMQRYYNVLDVDHFQLGLHTNLNSRYGGVQWILDNVPAPEVMGYRVYVRPLTLLAPDTWLASRYATGLNLSMDIDAPLTFRRVNAAENINTPLLIDEDGRLVPELTETAAVLGFDQEVVLVQDELIDFIPYLDVNFHLSGSPGLHLGTFTNVRPVESFSLYSRLELRWLGENYIPAYFGSLYEVERDSFFGFGGQGGPKLQVLKDLDRGSVLGVYGEATFDFAQLFKVTGAYEDYQGPDNAGLLLRLQVARIGPVNLGALYRKNGFDGIDDAFDLDNALLVTEARYHFNAFFYALVQYSRMWRLKEQATIDSDDPYDTVDQWFVGGGFSVGF